MELERLFEARVYKDEGEASLPYRIYTPKNIKQGEKYPLLLFLHGAGERGEDNLLQLKHVIPNLFSFENSPVFNSIVIVPQCPTEKKWVNTHWGNVGYDMDCVEISENLKLVKGILDEICEQYQIDRSRRYVMGISMGGFGTWDIIMRYPQFFAAAMPICGGASPKHAQRLVDVKIHTYHDSLDKVVPVQGTREIVESLKKAGADITYTETSQFGHNVWDYATKKQSEIEWLFSNSKK